MSNKKQQKIIKKALKKVFKIFKMIGWKKTPKKVNLCLRRIARYYFSELERHDAKLTKKNAVKGFVNAFIAECHHTYSPY